MKEKANHFDLVHIRVYQKRNSFYLFSSQPVLNPDNGRVVKWHRLCAVTEGKEHAAKLAKRIEDFNRIDITQGDMPRHIFAWTTRELEKRSKHIPKDPMKLRMFQTRNREILRLATVVSDAFIEFDVSEIRPADIALFVDQWEGQRAAQIYKSTLSKFFAWCCRNGVIDVNPAREVTVEKPKKRDIYITHEQFYQIRAALAVGKDGKPTPSGIMLQCYVDLCYLLYQRTTEIRLLKWEQITEKGILFYPTKTEQSSGLKVIIPMTTAICSVLEKTAEVTGKASEYVICNQFGKPYTAHGLATAWYRARDRAGLQEITLKDLRAKAITDARLAGYELEQISVGATHTDESMTAHYVKRHAVPTSEVVLQLPPRK